MATRMNGDAGWTFAEGDQHTKLVNHPANASRMRAFVCSFLEDIDVPEYVMDEVLMAVGEVVANACRHGRATSGTGVVDLRCGRRDQVVSIRVTDDGPGFDQDSVLPTGVPDVLSQGGRGFFLMSQLMDKVDIKTDSKGTTITLERALPN